MIACKPLERNFPATVLAGDDVEFSAWVTHWLSQGFFRVDNSIVSKNWFVLLKDLFGMEYESNLEDIGGSERANNCSDASLVRRIGSINYLSSLVSAPTAEAFQREVGSPRTRPASPLTIWRKWGCVQSIIWHHFIFNPEIQLFSNPEISFRAEMSWTQKGSRWYIKQLPGPA